MAMYGYTWVYIVIHGYTWYYMAIHGITLLYMAIIKSFPSLALFVNFLKYKAEYNAVRLIER